MATVHIGTLVAEDGSSRPVAIKQLRRDFANDPRAMTSLADEARIAAHVVHPNVVAIVEVVTAEKDLFIVMDYVEGASLAALLGAAAERGEPIPPAISLSFVTGTLAGLHAAHEARDGTGARLGVIHRDVSPQNVIVGRDGSARVLDFGIAKAIGRSYETQQNEIRGKLGYMAPEQLKRGVVDRRVDVYAAGVVTWEALTGERLFRGSTERETLKKVLQGAVAPPSTRAPGIPPALDAVVLRALARDPDARFATAEEMRRAIAAAARVASPAEAARWAERSTTPFIDALQLDLEETADEGKATALHTASSTIPGS